MCLQKPACRTPSVNYNRVLHTKEIKVPSANQNKHSHQGTSSTTPTNETVQISNELENKEILMQDVKDEHLNLSPTKINSISIPKLHLGSNKHERPGTLLVS